MASDDELVEKLRRGGPQCSDPVGVPNGRIGLGHLSDSSLTDAVSALPEAPISGDIPVRTCASFFTVLLFFVILLLKVL